MRICVCMFGSYTNAVYGNKDDSEIEESRVKKFRNFRCQIYINLYRGLSHRCMYVVILSHNVVTDIYKACTGY